MSDPLDKYRRKSPSEGEEIQQHDEKEYVAYRQSSKARRLIVRRKKEAHRAPGYSYLIDVMWDDTGTEIGLVFSHSTFMIRGKNLLDLALQIAAEKVAYVREYDPQKWQRPADGEPIVESIEVTTRITAPVRSESKPASE